MKIFRWLAAAVMLLISVPGVVHACSPAMTSLYEQFSRHTTVFLGTVGERVRAPAAGRGTYQIAVNEVFKSAPDKAIQGREIEITVSESEQCGLGVPKKNARILVFMNDGDVVNVTSHSRLIWAEAEQKEAHLNPMMDDLVTLRRMLFPKNQSGIAPDEETALHQALKVLVSVFGQAKVSEQMPFKVTYLSNKPSSEQRVWRVQGSAKCPKGIEPCRGSYGAEVNRWSGDVVRVFSGN